MAATAGGGPPSDFPFAIGDHVGVLTPMVNETWFVGTVYDCGSGGLTVEHVSPEMKLWCSWAMLAVRSVPDEEWARLVAERS